METLKNVPAEKSVTKPEAKSWVASRFVIVHEAGVAKRRCSYADCDKKFSRGTSHMILKRHWSRQHAEQFDDPSMRTSHTRGNFAGNKKSKKKSLSADNTGVTKNNTNTCHNNANNKPSNDKAQLDVKAVAKRLKEAISIHLSFDIYAPKKGGKSYGIITAHSLSDSLEIKTVLLEYKHLPYPNDSTAIFEFLRSCIIKFSIKEKIVSLASNCSEITSTAIQEVEKRFRLSKNYNFTTVHIRCFPRFVHLNVLDVLRSQESSIENVRKVVGFINNSNFTLRPMQASDPNASSNQVVDNNLNNSLNDTSTLTLESGQKATGIKLPYDNRSSWNTTYHMIENFLEQRGFIEPTLLYFQNPQDSSNINIDWDRLYTLIQLLKPFHDVVNKFALDNYAPVSLVAVSIPYLMNHLSGSSWAYEDLGMAAHNFKMQLESYRQQFQSDLTVLAGLLDPRVKDTFISAGERDEAISILRKRMNSSPQAKNETQNQYSENSIWSRAFRPVSYDEITDYLDSALAHGCINNIAYWEAHKNVYPSLYTLAKCLACVQATCVPNDRMFSAAENAEKERKNQIESTNSKELQKSWAKYLTN